ncbi:MAG: transglycosylase SLT domain-containing protein [Candidatus Woesearchaeota archaeon]|jgi:soluble lytic murein transglycosylase-like protein|nr:transglycosylase SLT domain-containing protein [Candidatus Woesearchaeota archaeon]
MNNIRKMMVLAFYIISFLLLLAMVAFGLNNITNVEESELQNDSELTISTLSYSQTFIAVIPEEYQEIVIDLHYRYPIVPLEYIYGIITVESKWDHTTVSNQNSNGTYDYGLVQANSQYIDYFGETFFDGEFDPFCPEQSIEFCFMYMDSLINRLNYDMKGAVMSYNIGINAYLAGNKLEQGEYYYGKVIREIENYSVSSESLINLALTIQR